MSRVFYKNESEKTKSPGPYDPGLLAERWGFEPQNAFDTLHDFQSCALDQLSHLSIFSSAPQRFTIIPERNTFVKDFFEKFGIAAKTTCLRGRRPA